MFGFGKKKPKTLWISMQDILKIMREDYEKESTFELIDFCYKGTVHRMGSCTIPLDEEPRKEDIVLCLMRMSMGHWKSFCSMSGWKV